MPQQEPGKNRSGKEKDDQKDKPDAFSGYLEEVIATQFAPEITTQEGKISVLTLWALALAGALYGGINIELNFSMEYFIPNGSVLKGFVDLDIEHFQTGYSIGLFTRADQIDITSVETQLQMLEWFEKLKRNYLCEEQWFNNQYFWRFWYERYNLWVRDGGCSHLGGGLSPFQKTVPPELFYLCYHEWKPTDTFCVSEFCGETVMSFEANALQR